VGSITFYWSHSWRSSPGKCMIFHFSLRPDRFLGLPRITVGRDCVVGIANSGRISVGARFFAAFQTGPGAHPASYTMGTGSLSRGVKRSGRGVDLPPSSSVRVKERVELYLYSPSGPSWPVLGSTLPFTFTGNQRSRCGFERRWVKRLSSTAFETGPGALPASSTMCAGA
jgi:hypothetical protein